ncbi:MAG: PMT family glycosyltransferase, 4-amino-4-deoxy-L-arabinose transferase [Microgenomates group bacterium Gr01-1014_16]|nr:MAG: PMT family glycosyltransferase, 4-amino-4-deoxy-L-arabinose transferase [Microgenomates group bacterium Gr01-1014_16]
MKYVLVFLFALVLRLASISSIPPGVYLDEASLGYNAFSLLLTGRDEYRQPLPVFLRSFGTYPPALSVYAAVPAIKFFGLSVFSYRLTPAVFGALSCLVFAILAARLLGQKVFLLSGVLFATNPGLMLWNRSFPEVTLALLLVLLGLVVFLHRRHYLGTFLLSLSTYAYQSPRVLVYLLILFLLIKYRRFSILAIFFLTQLPQIYFLNFSGPKIRLTNQLWFSQIPHTVTAVSREFLSQYLAYYSPQNLFWWPDPDPQRSLPELSLFYNWQVAPYLLGLIYLFFAWRQPLVIFLLAISPLAAALVKDPFSTTRASWLIVPLTLIFVPVLRRLHFSILVILTLFSLAQLYRSFFILLPHERADVWYAGYRQLYQKLDDQPLPALVDSSFPIYSLYLFYSRTPPEQVQAFFPRGLPDYYNQTVWQNYFSTNKIAFHPINWKTDIYKDQLIVGGPLSVSSDQALEHFLTPEFSLGRFTAYRTHPSLKCAGLSAKIDQCSR